MYKLIFYVPESHVEEVKAAVFQSGAGRLGNYDCCSWQTLGEGQFRPLEGSAPYLGQHAEVQRVAEYKVELLCPPACLAAAVRALRDAHPYEEPAFDVWHLDTPPAG